MFAVETKNKNSNKKSRNDKFCIKKVKIKKNTKVKKFQ